MANTRLMDRLFSATENKEEDVLNQTAQEIEKAKENGSHDTDELAYEKVDDNKVKVTDKENGEVTMIENSEDGYEIYNPEDVLEDEQPKLEGFLHPEVDDQVVPGEQTNPTEKVEDHENEPISPNVEGGGLNPEAGQEKSVEETAAEGPQPEESKRPECGKEPCECKKEEPKKEEEEKKFSVYTSNSAVHRIFSDQEFCERLFSEVLESAGDVEDVTKVGNLKIEKTADNELIVTDCATGDAAKVSLDAEELSVTELEKKTFSEEGSEGINQPDQFEPVHVVGVDTGNHQLVDSSAYGAEEAQELANRLTEAGVDGVQVIEDEEAARDYAIDLLNNLGVNNPENVEEPEEVTFSDTEGKEYSVFVTRYFSNNTIFMDRLFSESANGVETSQAKIEDALKSGDEIETDSEVVTPISATEAVVEDKDNDQFTKVTLVDDELKLDPISKDEADELLDDIAVSEEEKDFSDIWTNEARTKFFSENEPMTAYMERLFSDEEKEELIEEAIEKGEQNETDTIVITPVDAETAIIQDKGNGEFTKAVLSEEDIDLAPISEEEADKLTEEKKVEEEPKKEEEKKAEEEAPKEEKEEEKGFSVLTKWFTQVVPAQAQPVVAAPQAAPIPVAPAVDENGQPVVPANEVPSVEAIEDKAIAAVQQIQAAAAEAEAQILNAKAAPVENAEVDLQEAQFSEKKDEKTFSANENDSLVSWLNGISKFRR